MNLPNMQRAPPTDPYEKVNRTLWGKYKYTQVFPLALVIRPKEVSTKLKCHFHLPWWQHRQVGNRHSQSFDRQRPRGRQGISSCREQPAKSRKIRSVVSQQLPIQELNLHPHPFIAQWTAPFHSYSSNYAGKERIGHT